MLSTMNTEQLSTGKIFNAVKDKDFDTLNNLIDNEKNIDKLESLSESIDTEIRNLKELEAKLIRKIEKTIISEDKYIENWENKNPYSKLSDGYKSYNKFKRDKVLSINPDIKQIELFSKLLHKIERQIKIREDINEKEAFINSLTQDEKLVVDTFRKFDGEHVERHLEYCLKPLFNFETNEIIIIEPANRGSLYVMRSKIDKYDLYKSNYEHFYNDDNTSYSYDEDLNPIENFDNFIQGVEDSSLFKGLKKESKYGGPYFNKKECALEYDDEVEDYISFQGHNFINDMASMYGFRTWYKFSDIKELFCKNELQPIYLS